MDSLAIQIISKVISILTVLSCLFLKVPQIMDMRRKRSAEGIYVQAMIMEVAGYTIVTLYNYANNYSVITYLEYPIIMIQVYIMLYYVLKFRGLLYAPVALIGAMLYLSIIIGFVTDALPKEVLSYSLPLCTPISGSAKIAYIYGIYKTANAGDVSRMTWLISMLTNLSRLFTVYVDSGDVKLMINLLVSTMLSAGVLGTAVYYQLYRFTETRRHRRMSDEYYKEQ